LDRALVIQVLRPAMEALDAAFDRYSREVQGRAAGNASGGAWASVAT
jgi:hypothetical protein